MPATHQVLNQVPPLVGWNALTGDAALTDGLQRLGGDDVVASLQRLGARALRIGPQIDPGVPWTVSIGEPALALALKSGNFGGPDFFTRAFTVLP